MGSIPVGTQIFSLSHAYVMLINSPFPFHYQALKSSLFNYKEFKLCLLGKLPDAFATIGNFTTNSITRTFQED